MRMVGGGRGWFLPTLAVVAAAGAGLIALARGDDPKPKPAGAARAPVPAAVVVARPPATSRPFFEAHCLSCHSEIDKKGGLDLGALADDLRDAAAFETWVKIHDKVRAGEMPPPASKAKKAAEAESKAFVADLAGQLAAADRDRAAVDGRALVRRMTRFEYENTVRDLLHLPGLSIAKLLPEDGRAFGFDKASEGLELSQVQLAKYMEAADLALDLAIAPTLEPPQVFRKRLYPAQQYDVFVLIRYANIALVRNMKFDPTPGIPLLHEVISDEVLNPIRGNVEKYDGSVAVLRHQYPEFLGRFSQFVPYYTGHYRLRYSVWSLTWDKGEIKPSPLPGAMSLTQGGRVLKYFEAPSLEPTVHELIAWLDADDYIRFNAASRWPIEVSQKQATADFNDHAVAMDWLDVEGPLYDAWPPASHRRLFGNLRLVPLPLSAEVRPPKRPPPTVTLPAPNGPGPSRPATVLSHDPIFDASKLLGDFLTTAFRRPVSKAELGRYVDLVRQRLRQNFCFEDAMRAAYKAALCSPDFLFFRQKPGPLDDWALASRLSYFLWSTAPDEELRRLAAKGKLREPGALRQQAERMLADPRSERFVADFVEQWLDLREMDLTTPDAMLYPEFGPYLRDSMVAETRAYFRDMLMRNLGVANIVDSDYAILNQRMAQHYGVPGVVGTAFRRVELPPGSHRGGLITQASILKVTANGTTTSPVKRGAWVMRKIVGKPPDPPPPNLPAIEPDLRGATTVRELLEKHRSNASCSACHAKMDPPGFALESFDPIGGWQDRYRILGEGLPADPVRSWGNVVPYKLGQPVDCSGKTVAGEAFRDIDQFRRLLLADQRQIARNLLSQFVIYATGAPVGFADRATVERILDDTAKDGYGVRSLLTAVVETPMFRNK